MALGAQLPVRLEPEVERRLQEIAEQVGTSKSALIRLLAKTFVDHVIDSRGHVHLPPDWAELLPKADRRSTEERSGSGPSIRYPAPAQSNLALNETSSKPLSGEAKPGKRAGKAYGRKHGKA